MYEIIAHFSKRKRNKSAVISFTWVIKGLYTFCSGFTLIRFFLYDSFPLFPHFSFVPVSCLKGPSKGGCVWGFFGGGVEWTDRKICE